MHYQVIDKGVKYFDVEVHDVNNDGRLDLLVSINSEDDGSLVVYEIPDDFRWEMFPEMSVILADEKNVLSPVIRYPHSADSLILSRSRSMHFFHHR